MTADSGPSFPTLLAEEARASITEYLATTFALADASARDALEAFLGDQEHGIFRGPYLQVRLPYQRVDDGWTPLGWLPAGFTPFRHQAAAFARLSTRDGPARPTIVTTGTGSGKTEAFLLPLLDHARRARARGETGIKAIVLYPMNALVTDQARRLANLLYYEPALRSVTAGVYIGGPARPSPRPVTRWWTRATCCAQQPPDILLTNYKMLDLLLLRAADAPLWSDAAASLQYVVLDEFHTYDGAQGTDVAMLLRRLGATCRVAEAGRPLGRITPVATSATLGGSDRSAELRTFAERIFGVPFGPDALVGEERLSADDVVPDVDFNLAIPDVDAITAADLPASAEPQSWRSLAEAVLAPLPTPGQPPSVHDYTDRVALGDLLRRHFLTRVVVESLADRPLTPAEAVTRITRAGVLPWGVRNATDPAAVEQALLRFLALLSTSQVRDPGWTPRPVVTVTAQLWVRELTRMLRRVNGVPEFAWWHDGPDAENGRWLPAAHCRVCGRSGWIATVTELGDSLGRDPVAIWRASAKPSARSKTRTLLLAGDDEAGVRFLDPTTLEMTADPRERSIPVLVTADRERAVRQECPSCGSADSIRFLGSSVATLLSVGLTQLFGSDLLPDGEKKTLVFTDSVQDAAHRAAFIEGRAFQFNFRSALLNAVGSAQRTLADTAAALTAELPVEDLYAVTPPDFVRRKALTGAWLSGAPRGRMRKLLATRIAFQAHLELGLNSRLGRTLELTGALAVDVDADLGGYARLAREIHDNLPEHTPLPGATPDETAYQRWLLGLFEHLRTRGGISHRWLDAYRTDDGKRWAIWGGSPDGMPKFPQGRPAPGFFTTGRAADIEFLGLQPRGDSWLTDWTRRCLGAPAPEARALLPVVVDSLAGDDGPLERRTSASAAKVYGLCPERIVLDADPDSYARLQCPQCQHLQPATTSRAELWHGAPCPRLRCDGRLALIPNEPENFYRSLYRSGRIRRIVAAEHTSMLDRVHREDVERRFKTPTSPIDPNILTCTPTLELGIDIGDLSTVTLASLPRATANYLQRVGRAGRTTGNAYVLTAVPSSPRDLYCFAEPRHLLAGDVVPPGAYLNATELLQRQFVAFCLDRVASGDLPLGRTLPPRLDGLLAGGMADGAWLRTFLDAVVLRGEELGRAFLGLYGDALEPPARQAVEAFARDGIRWAAGQAVLDWTRQTEEITGRMRQLALAISDLAAKGPLGDLEKEDLKRCRGESKALQLQLRSLREAETLTGLTTLGLLPSYNLLDDATSSTCTCGGPAGMTATARRRRWTSPTRAAAGPPSPSWRLGPTSTPTASGWRSTRSTSARPTSHCGAPGGSVRAAAGARTRWPAAWWPARGAGPTASPMPAPCTRCYRCTGCPPSTGWTTW
ncbi:MAG: DEAD/DEAH box helicase [Frankiaceae bacterium]